MKQTTISSALAGAVLALEQAGITPASLDASLLLAHVLHISREQVMFLGDRVLDNNEILELNAYVARRAQHEPVAYITGIKEFWSLDFCVTRDTLIPRPDSETLVEAALKRARNRTTTRDRKQEQTKPIALLDIGTGTGCLLIALLKELPTARGVGLDNSERALQVASENAKRHGVDSRAQFVKSHWCDALDGTFDLILSNPPYIAEGAMHALMPDVLRFEPHTALAAGEDGLDAYLALSTQMTARLNPGGYVLFEVGQGQDKAVSDLLAAQGLLIEPPEKDLADIVRCVIAKRDKN